MTHTNAVEMDSIKTKAAEAIAKAKDDHEKKVETLPCVHNSSVAMRFLLPKWFIWYAHMSRSAKENTGHAN